MSPADGRRSLEAALNALDSALKAAPESADLLQQKASTIAVLARIEQDPQRVQALQNAAAALTKKVEARKVHSK